jgi:hypothetical protein
MRRPVGGSVGSVGRVAERPALSDEAWMAGLAPLIAALEAMGFVRDLAQPQPTWERPRVVAAEGEGVEGEGEGEKVVLWRHPRLPWEVHGYVASSLSPHAVHLRFLDPDWQPDQVLPGHWDKGFAFETATGLEALAERLREVIWPRALAWFEAPVSAEALLGARARVMSLVRPGRVLEQHRGRVAWLEAHERHDEAAFVRGIIAQVEALFADAPSGDGA